MTKKKGKRKYKKNTPDPGHRKGRHHKKHYRRNPPVRIGLRSLPNMLMNGAIDATEIVVGKASVRVIPTLIGFPAGTPTNMIVQALSAVLVGWVGSSFISSNAGKMLLAGGLASPIEDLIKGANIPLLSAALGEELYEIGEEDFESYPEFEAYPEFEGMGEIGEEEEDELAEVG